MKREEAMKILKDFHDKSALFSVRTALDTIIPELKESEDESIRMAIKEAIRSYWADDTQAREDCIAWIEKQKDINALIQEAYVKGYTEGIRDY